MCDSEQQPGDRSDMLPSARRMISDNTRVPLHSDPDRPVPNTARETESDVTDAVIMRDAEQEAHTGVSNFAPKPTAAQGLRN